MASPAFTLSVPAAEPFRGLVAEAVRVYLRASGQEASPATEAFAASVAGVVERLADRGTDIEMVVAARSPRIDVHLTCGGVSESLTHTVATTGG